MKIKFLVAMIICCGYSLSLEAADSKWSAPVTDSKDSSRIKTAIGTGWEAQVQIAYIRSRGAGPAYADFGEAYVELSDSYADDPAVDTRLILGRLYGFGGGIQFEKAGFGLADLLPIDIGDRLYSRVGLSYAYQGWQIQQEVKWMDDEYQFDIIDREGEIKRSHWVYISAG
ncbi:MAG: hypothetical protein AAFR59_14665, partial [Bacteroidota bacterium]